MYLFLYASKINFFNNFPNAEKDRGLHECEHLNKTRCNSCTVVLPIASAPDCVTTFSLQIVTDGKRATPFDLLTFRLDQEGHMMYWQLRVFLAMMVLFNVVDRSSLTESAFHARARREC